MEQNVYSIVKVKNNPSSGTIFLNEAKTKAFSQRNALENLSPAEIQIFSKKEDHWKCKKWMITISDIFVIFYE